MNKFSSPLERTRTLRKAASQNLLAFTQYTKPDYAVNWHHARLAEKLDRVARGECRRLMIFMPPQHGKSELISRRFPAFLLGRNPNVRLIACSHTSDLAVAMNRDVQRIIAGKAFRAVFPEVALNRPARSTAAELSGFPSLARQAREFPSLARRASIGSRGQSPLSALHQSPGPAVAARRTMDLFEIPGRRGSLRSAGVGSAIVGNPADGAIIDDPIGKREDAESSVVRERIWQWYSSDLYTRLSKDGWIVLTHTRWHRDDLAGRLLRKMADRSGDQWETLCLPAVRPEGPGDPCDPRAAGEVLWPEFKSGADLDIIRRQDPRTYAALYQQDPAESGGTEWPAELFGDWMWVPPERWPTEFETSVVCVDPSKGRSDKHGDYSAIVFVGLGKDGLIYVDAVLERIPLDQIVRKTLVFCDLHRPQHVGIEAEQFQELLVYEFRRQCRETGRPMYRVERILTNGLPKAMRIRRLAPYISCREFRFRSDSPGCRLLVDQLMDYPLADHDDGPDALEMGAGLIAWARRPQEVVTYQMIPMDIAIRMIEQDEMRRAKRGG